MDCENDFIIQFKEHEFQQKYNLQDYNQSAKSTSACILYSQSTKRTYNWPSEIDLTIDTLKPYFESSGHTLNIDYVKTYTRNAAWDIDCICRKYPVSNHNNENIINNLCGVIIDQMRITIEKNLNIICSIWRKNCGFHIYTNIRVSLPLHLHLTHILQIKTSQMDEFTSVIIEFPEKMPLPYSAKVTNDPYLPVLVNQQHMNIKFTDLSSNFFYECITIDDVSTEHEICMLQTNNTPLRYINLKKVYQNCTEFNFGSVIYCQLNHSFGYMDILYKYIIFTKEDLSLNSLSTENATSDCEFLNKFIKYYNKYVWNLDDSDNWQLFFNDAFMRTGSLDLQHFIVLIQKYIGDIEKKKINYDKFKENLKDLFRTAEFTDEDINYHLAEHIIQNYNPLTYNSYATTFSDMIIYLKTYTIFEITPFMTQHEIITNIMKSKLNVNDIEKYCGVIDKKDKKDGDRTVQMKKIFNEYINILILFKYLQKNDAHWWLSNEKGHYDSKNSMNAIQLPGISMWFSQKSIICELNRQIQHFESQFQNNDLWTQNNFFMSTNVGDFNSISGLYFSRIPFLRFSLYREKMIWPKNCSPKMYLKQNADILKTRSEYLTYIENIESIVDNLYIHYQLIPAILNVKHCAFIQQSHISDFFLILFKYEDYFPKLHFLLESFPMNLQYIGSLMSLFLEYSVDVLFDYERLRNHICCRGIKLTANDRINFWSSYFKIKSSNLTYDKTAETYFEKIKSLSSNLIKRPSDKLCFVVAIYGYIISKCSTYNDLLNSFDINNLIEYKPLQNSLYDNFEFGATVDILNKNLERAIQITFSETQINDDEQIILLIVSHAISVGFDKDCFVELFNMFSNFCVTNNLTKKIFILHGEKNTGKTRMLDRLQNISKPFQHRCMKLSEVVDRSNVTSRNNIVIINEAKCLEPNEVKAVTGGDSISGKIFFSQSFMGFNTQALLFAATNLDIEFKEGNKNVKLVDWTTVDRIHAIRFKGEVTNEIENFFEYFVTNQHFLQHINKSINEHFTSESTNSFLWLIYLWYYKTREVDFLPHINVNNIHVLEYKEKVYSQNNCLIKFLSQCNFKIHKKTYIEKTRFLEIVQNKIDTNQFYYKFMFDFKFDFNFHFRVNIDNLRKIDNILERELFTNIEENFEIEIDEHSNITKQDIMNRTQMYEQIDWRENAIKLFEKKNRNHYNTVTGIYESVKFKYDISNRFNFDETCNIDNLPFAAESDSNVLQTCRNLMRQSEE